MKLKESIPSNSTKIIDLYNKIDSDILDTRPNFQRKLVWKKQHKFQFIQTILMNFPFPEVYVASAEMDVEKLMAKEIVVDGQQRLTTIVDYIKGINDFKDQTKVPAFEQLSNDEKKDFLNYLVIVRDLKDMKMDLIKEIFRRINNTEYSLNAVEKTNAQYGDGEFSIFCKQIVDSSYNPTDDVTDIVLEKQIKLKLNNFFLDNNVFSDNDKSRMFDIQYAMLIVSTILEGNYYGRSLKVEEYLKKYNSSFELYQKALDSLIKSVDIILKLHLNKKSYWYNKANLFTLIIELSNKDNKNLDLNKLEHRLLDLETKNDDYFSEIDLDTISDDEKKYFEFARQGSNEKVARVHRGKVISKIITESLSNGESASSESRVPERLKFFEEKKLNYVIMMPTETALTKSIMDATYRIRNFLKDNDIHDYEKQENGANHKKKIEAFFILEDQVIDIEVSLYRSNHRGDARIWFTDLKLYAKPGDTILLVFKNNNIYLINISNLEIENLAGKNNPFNDQILK